VKSPSIQPLFEEVQAHVNASARAKRTDLTPENRALSRLPPELAQKSGQTAALHGAALHGREALLLA
jgi:hypothetical protein